MTLDTSIEARACKEDERWHMPFGGMHVTILVQAVDSSSNADLITARGKLHSGDPGTGDLSRDDRAPGSNTVQEVSAGTEVPIGLHGNEL